MASYQPRDKFYRQARAQGLPSRAAFKLKEILERYPILTPNARIVDLGCAPGGWLQILAQAAPSGRIVGVDLVACRAPAPSIEVIVGDACEQSVQQRIIEALGGAPDLVTSDMAPKLSGIRLRDEARSLQLLEVAARFAAAIVRPQGTLIAKVFMSADLNKTVATMRPAWRSLELLHTHASRPGSRELYLLARGYLGARAPA
ncbi:MAG TPA: RlmE family RNA methyltransferase [Candidatus Binataceae bacterium]|nr:RlmE family RNA methyltransferase [Candidatus Binataceae bacterium]